MADPSSSIAAVILGAGTSSRFTGNKLISLIDGKPAIGRVLEAALSSRLGKVVLVLGHENDAVRAALGDSTSDERVSVEVISDYGEGQSRSVITGLRALQAGDTAVMYLMGDQPLITPAIINSLIAAFETSNKAICYPSFNGKRRNPVIFAASLFPDILALKGDTGARAIIDTNPDQTCAVPFDSEMPFLDIDTTAEYRKISHLFRDRKNDR